MCDFGISGYLSGSQRTVDVGCKEYMAPERIDPAADRAHYDTRSDIWSFGISMIEISTGFFPYESWTTLFAQQSQVVMEEPPCLPATESFSPTYQDFITQTLQKRVEDRPNPNELLTHPFLQLHCKAQTDISSFVVDILDNIAK